MKKVLSMLAVLAAVFVFAAMPASASTDEAASDQEKMDMLIRSIYEDYEAEGYTEVPMSAAKARAAIDVPPEVLELAYSDLDSATPEKMVEILKARNQVAYSAGGWCADGAFATSGDANTKTWYRLPNFSELFPGWDLPCDDPEAKVAKMLNEKDEAAAGHVARQIVSAGQCLGCKLRY